MDLLAASVLSTVDVKKANMIKILDQIQQQAGRSLTEEETKKARAAVLEGLANMEAAQTLEPRTEEIAQAMTKQLLKQRLTIKPLHRLHTINPDKPVFCAASASDKKTCLIEAATGFMTKSDHAPREIKKSMVFASNGSVRGLREAIVQYHKDEVVTMIATPWSESGTSNVYISRSKLCTFSQGERDDVLTANGALHLRSYSFQLKACGQLEPMEWLLRPGPQGWFKRPCLRVSMGHNEHINDFPAEYATGLIQALHDFQFLQANQTPTYIHADASALTLFRAVQSAIKEWIQDNEENVDRFLQVKLLFSYSDILRDASARMRMVQCLEAQNKNDLATRTELPGFILCKASTARAL